MEVESRYRSRRANAFTEIDFEGEGDERCARLRQTVIFDPLGLFGLLSWYGRYPSISWSLRRWFAASLPPQSAMTGEMGRYPDWSLTEDGSHPKGRKTAPPLPCLVAWVRGSSEWQVQRSYARPAPHRYLDPTTIETYAVISEQGEFSPKVETAVGYSKVYFRNVVLER